jgi:hypothetical protein
MTSCHRSLRRTCNSPTTWRKPEPPAALALRARHLNGEFDASKEESDAWAESPEGKATLATLAHSAAQPAPVPPTKNYSDKLKEAMAEINAVLEKHDVAALVVLHEPGFSEFRTRIDPSWSVCHFEPTKDGDVAVRFRAKAEDFGGDKAAQKKAIDDTVNMIVHFRDNCAMHFKVMDGLLDMLGKRFEIAKEPGRFTPDRKH